MRESCRTQERVVSTTVEILPPTISVELLGISRRSAYRAASRGQIPTVRVGRRLLVPTQRLLAMLGMAEGEQPERRVAPPVQNGRGPERAPGGRDRGRRRSDPSTPGIGVATATPEERRYPWVGEYSGGARSAAAR